MPGSAFSDYFPAFRFVNCAEIGLFRDQRDQKIDFGLYVGCQLSCRSLYRQAILFV